MSLILDTCEFLTVLFARQIREAVDAGADLVEIRVDLLQNANEWERILREASLPTIVTNRASWEGGKCQSSEIQRLQSLLRAAELGAQHIDVELRAFPLFRQCLLSQGLSLPLESTKLIISYHDFDNSLTLKQIDQILATMRSKGADICKIAMKATSALDNCTVFHALQTAQTPSIILAMGEIGQPTRILAPKFGSYLSFAAVGEGAESAPGQISAHSLKQMYRYHDIKPSTPAYGVIGSPIRHSMSPALHNAAMAQNDLNGVFVACKVEDDYPEFIRGMCDLGFNGFSVTIPAKEIAIDAMDQMDDVAQKIGAMNTVVKQPDGNLKGYNTDWIAAISAIEDHLSNGIRGKRVVCIGAGGAGKALAYGALERGALRVCIVNRTKAKAETLARELGEKAIAMSLEEFNSSEGDFEVLMNTTSVGMYPKIAETPVNKERLLSGSVVFDAVYNPLKTRLLSEAESMGCITVSGLEMFVRQAAEQFCLWFPREHVPIETMRKAVLKKLRS